MKEMNPGEFPSPEEVGSEGWFVRELEKYEGAALGIIRSQMYKPFDENNQEDILQVAKSNAWKGLGKYKGDPSNEDAAFRRWYLRIVQNVIFDYFRDAKSSPDLGGATVSLDSGLDPGTGVPFMNILPSNSSSPESRAIAGVDIRRLDGNKSGRLSFKNLERLVQHYGDGFTVQEIAEKDYGKKAASGKVGTTKSRLSRARSEAFKRLNQKNSTGGEGANK